MNDAPPPPPSDADDGGPTTKEQILGLYLTGIRDVEDLAMLTGARPSYVGSVLQEAGLREDYFDLYTSTSHPMNVYSKFFAGELGFKDVETARDYAFDVRDTVGGLWPGFMDRFMANMELTEFQHALDTVCADLAEDLARPQRGAVNSNDSL